MAGFAAGLCLKSGLCILAGIEPDGRVVLKMGDPGRVRVLSDGALLLVGPAARPRTVPHRLQAWVVHRHRLAAATARNCRWMLHLPPTSHGVFFTCRAIRYQAKLKLFTMLNSSVTIALRKLTECRVRVINFLTDLLH